MNQDLNKKLSNMKARMVDIDKPTWITINTDNVKQIHLTPFGYFNIEFKNGRILSFDILDATV